MTAVLLPKQVTCAEAPALQNNAAATTAVSAAVVTSYLRGMGISGCSRKQTLDFCAHSSSNENLRMPLSEPLLLLDFNN
jgi:hypothetical protein